MNAKGHIVIAGGIVERALAGGHAWVFIQYLLGFKRLGFTVTMLDHVRTPTEFLPYRSLTSAARRLHDVFRQVALQDSLVILDCNGESVLGGPLTSVLLDVRRSAALINVMGYLRHRDLCEAAPRLVFLDIDPGVAQIWRELRLADLLAGHDTYVTVGENVGSAHCGVPTCDLDWHRSPQPVVLEEWPMRGQGRRFTTVATWRGPYGPLQYKGSTYGSRVHEFRKFVKLPNLAAVEFELALDIEPAEEADLELLARNGWTLVDPVARAGDADSYRRYIQGSRAELCVAKNIYVDTHSGWLSDRSICYLASGKPVLAQDTGFSRNYPTGEGLLAFSTLDEAAAGVEEIEGSYDRHSKAARELAEEYFDSDKVLGRLLERLGVA